MVHKSEKAEAKPRGRPREYDPDAALWSAMSAFWSGGFAGTSLDQLGTAMGMNRPSLYAAFGDKQALFMMTLERYVAQRHEHLRASLLGVARPLREALLETWQWMIDFFLEGEGGGRGCYLVAAAVTEAQVNPPVRALLALAQRDLDRLFRDAFTAAHARGELARGVDPALLATFASAVVHTLALRARSGQSRAQLRELAGEAVDFLCAGGAAGPAPGKKPGKVARG